MPSVAGVQQTGLTGKAKVTAVNVEGISLTSSPVTIAPGEQVKLLVDTELGDLPLTGSGMAIAFGGTCGGGIATEGTIILPPR